jgi:uncharacterized protein
LRPSDLRPTFSGVPSLTLGYRPATWLGNRHLMTIYASLVRRPLQLRVARQRWETPDADFLDVDRIDGSTPSSPLVLVLHGLEGSSRAGYVRGTLVEARARGYAGLALNFRGCSGEPNRLARSYHSGDTRDLAAVVEALIAERPDRQIGLVGFSLGGNVLAKWFGELGRDLPPQIVGGVAISPPLDLAASAAVLDAPGFWPAIYRKRFLRSLKRKAIGKARRFPQLLDGGAVRSAETFAEFDDLVTAPLNGFRDAVEYWRLSSAAPLLEAVRRPLHILTAADDPFVPTPSIPESAWITEEIPPAGGHVAFVEGSPWRTVRYAERRSLDFLEGLLSAS